MLTITNKIDVADAMRAEGEKLILSYLSRMSLVSGE